MDRFNNFHFVILISSLLYVACSFCSGDQSSIFPLPDPIIPEECLSREYCENVPNYPEELASKLAGKISTLGPKMSIQAEIHIELCRVNKTIVTPKAAKDSAGKWHYILNPKDNPVQQYEEVKCRHHRHGVQSCGDMLHFKHTWGRCQQRTNVVSYQTMDKYGIVTSVGNFSVFCCCVCNGYIKPIK